jgi:hypothetical protein
MNRLLTGEMPDLKPAREPGCNHCRVQLERADCGQETLFSDESRELVMLGLVTERAGHPAAADLKVDFIRADINIRRLLVLHTAGHAPASAGWAPPHGFAVPPTGPTRPGSAHLTYLFELSDQTELGQGGTPGSCPGC